MEDGKEEPPVDPGSDGSDRSIMSGKRSPPRNLRSANIRMREEALRRYRMQQANEEPEARKSRNLKEATQHLKAEALRRYQLKHKDSLDRKEALLKEKLAQEDLDLDSEAENVSKESDTNPEGSVNGEEEDQKSLRNDEQEENNLKSSSPSELKAGADRKKSKSSKDKSLSSSQQESEEQVQDPSDSEENPGADSHAPHGNPEPHVGGEGQTEVQEPAEGQAKEGQDPEGQTSEAKEEPKTDTEAAQPEETKMEENPETSAEAPKADEAAEQSATEPAESEQKPSEETKPEEQKEAENKEPEAGEQKAEETDKPAEATPTASQEATTAEPAAENPSAAAEESAKPADGETGEKAAAPAATEQASSEEKKDGEEKPAEGQDAPAAKPEGEGQEVKEGQVEGQASEEAPAASGEAPAEAPSGGETQATSGGDEVKADADKPAEQEQAAEGEKPAEAEKPAEGSEAPAAADKPAESAVAETDAPAGEQTQQEAAPAPEGGSTDAAGTTAEGQAPTGGEGGAPAAEGEQAAATTAESTEKPPAGEEAQQATTEGAAAPDANVAPQDGAPPKEGEAQQATETAAAPAAATSEQKPAESAGQAVEERSESADGMDPDTRGDEAEIHSESPVDDSAPKIPEDFYYKAEEHVSRPRIMEDSGLPSDILTLHHSFGYDCHKRANLQMLDENTAVFAAGNVVELLDLKTKEQKYLRSSSGGGIGAIAVHPSHKYIAIAEKGVAPNINIFEYPSLKLYRILRGGTQAAYAYVDFSPDGKLLSSVGGDPDYMLTLWDWRNEMIMLRSKAFSQDVFRVTFSSELQGQLTSSGTGHIRFWKMAKTFTGLKLQGSLGKFGKTEISDIEGYVELPDGKVLSGCEWGNLLVWDGGLIKVEISRKGKKPCHNGIIQQIIMDEGELMTIGTDGYIKVWDFETVDTADITDESSVFEMEPMNELKVGDDVQLKSIVKSVHGEEPTMWYAQDASGGIWKLDLSFSFTSMAPEKLASYHAGVITGCDTSPVSHLVATTGGDRSVRVYDYVAKEVLCESHFNQGGCSLLWAPKIVDTRGATILIGFDDGVVRALTLQTVDGVDIHGRKKENVSELVLKQAFKPHTKEVRSMAIDHKGELLATGSDDKTVFFFNIEKSYEPIGFIRTPSAVTHLGWSPSSHSKNTLMICCRDGEVLEYVAPEDGIFDTSKTFEINGMDFRYHKFKSIKSRLRHEEEQARKSQELEEKRQKEEEERRIRIERGLETESENGDEETKDEDDEEEWSPFIPQEPSPILSGIHAKDEGKVWLSMGDFDAGYLYEATFHNAEEKMKLSADQLYEPSRHLPMLETNDVPVTVMQYSEDGKRVIMGMQDGSIRIHPLTSGDIGELGPYWVLNAHDNQYGHITHIAASFDQKFLFTVGADGNFFTFNMMGQDTVDQKVTENKAKIPSAKKPDSERRIDDIDDPNAYSIEDAKQKAEHDKMIRLAEEKKLGVKRSIETLRQSFRKLLSKNNQLPSHLLLDRKEFEMDPEIKRELEEQKQEKIDMVKKEMAWEEEKFKIALDKLRTRFKDIVECERIIVKAFHTKHEVCSFRSTKLPDDFYIAKSEMEKRKTTMLSNKDDLGSRQATQDLLKGQTSSSDAQAEGGGMADPREVKVMTTLKGSMGERINKALVKVEEKKRKRAHRRAQWEDLLSSKPDDNYEDPADVSAIREAQDNMGDYKLKSADDYVVPDHLRMNTDKARSKLLVLKDLIHQCKYDFNQRLLALRDKKIGIIEEVRGIVKQLSDVQENMAVDDVKQLPEIPEMHPDELPEKKFEYTRETLTKFKKNMAKRKPTQQGDDGGGFGGFGGNGAPSTPSLSATPVASATQRTPVDTSAQEKDQTFMDMEIKETPIQAKMRRAEEIRSLYVRNQLLQRVEEVLKNFDAELRVLRHEKFQMDISLKNADLRQVTLFEELLLLKDFEKRENVLAAKVDHKQQEKQDMQAKVIEVQNNITTKKKDIEKLQERERTLHAQFVTSLGENNKFGDYLTKVFKKRIKRSKKKANEGEGSDEESDDESDDDSDWSESEEESESEEGGYDLDACPQGCDQNLYDNTCTLREKRLDIEEALAEEKKNRDSLTKELDALNKKTKVIDNALRQAENELEAFQLEKQRKLNELDVVVTVKLHQIQYMINGVLPQDLSPALIFEATGVTRLVHRIKELEHEKSSQKKQQKEARKKHIQLNKDRKVFEARISEMEDVCNKMMLQKFGRIVDLEKLETVTVNRNIEELKEKLRNNEITCSSELVKWEERIKEAREFITQLVRENTQRLDQLNMLLVERKDFEVALDSRQKNLGGEFTGVRKSDVHERQRLIQLVHLQAQEVEALKEEITLLSRKGGHILPPAQPPMPQSGTGPRQPVMPTA